MGCGVAEPLSITKDITFPNYDLPKLDDIRGKWQASSFINIDKEIIEDLVKGDTVILKIYYCNCDCD